MQPYAAAVIKIQTGQTAEGVQVHDAGELFDDVPEAKSSRSTSAVRRPRLAASSATPTPVIPPPMTSTSKVSVPNRSNIADRWKLSPEPTSASYGRSREGPTRGPG